MYKRMNETNSKKGILKNKGSDIHRSKVTFDEAELAEFDLQRGQRMKIDEPKTPFVFDGDDENISKAERAERVKQINEQLAKEIEKLKSLDKSSGEEQDKADREEEKRKLFLMKRKQHYHKEFVDSNPKD